MKFSSKLTKLLAIILPILFLVSCDEDDNGNVIEGNNSIINYFEKTPDYSLFLEAITRVGLQGTLDGNSGSYTIFAPNNEAVNAYLQAHSYASVNAIPEDTLYQLISYHILESLNKKENFVTGYLKPTAITALNDSTDVNVSMYVQAADNEVLFNGNTLIINPDIDLDNGIMQQIDHVLELPTMKTFLEADENLSPFYEAMLTEGTATDFNSFITSNNNGQLMFAPNANAIQTFYDEEGVTAANELPLETLDNTIRNHFIEEAILSSSFVNQYKTTKATESVTGENHAMSIYMSTTLGLMLNGNARIVIPDIVAINGIIDVTDAVVRLPSLGDFVIADNDLTTLTEAFMREDQVSEAYLDLLSADETENPDVPYTLFTPNNAAYANLLLELYPTEDASIDSIETAQMTSILKLHMVPAQNLRQENLSAGTLNAVEGSFTVNADGTLTDPNERNSSLIQPNIQATNGVMHTIDTVLLP